MINFLSKQAPNMNNPEQIIIPKSAMINLSHHEDDDVFIVETPIIAIPVGKLENGGIPVRIPSLDPERTYYYHQPEKSATE
jgi:hypothetical protein